MKVHYYQLFMYLFKYLNCDHALDVWQLKSIKIIKLLYNFDESRSLRESR